MRPAVLACCPDHARPLRSLARPAPSTSAAPARRSTTGCWRAGRRAGSSSCGSRTPTASARRRRTSSRSSRRCAGWGSTGTASRCSSPSAPSATPRSSSSCWPAATPTAPPPGPDEVQRVQGGATATAASAARTRARARSGCACPTRARRPSSTSSAARRAFENALQDDLVIARADGTPVYHLAVVVDDHDAGITHVVRGADHYSNTPKHVADPAGDGHRHARLRPPAAAARPGRQEALQAPRRGLRAGAARPRLPARGGAQLPRAARLGLSTRRRRSSPPRSCSGTSRSSRCPSRRRCSTSRSCAG